jgi:hypothetical protein
VRRVLLVFSAVVLCGCEDFDAAMVSLSDELSFADGYYYDDEHHSDPIDGDCPSLWEYGRVGNQAYARVTNRGSSDVSATITWTAGAPIELYLAPGEVSDFIYRSGSNIPQSVEVTC